MPEPHPDTLRTTNCEERAPVRGSWRKIRLDGGETSRGAEQGARLTERSRTSNPARQCLIFLPPLAYPLPERRREGERVRVECLNLEHLRIF